jgi:hypothetical protein
MAATFSRKNRSTSTGTSGAPRGTLRAGGHEYREPGPEVGSGWLLSLLSGAMVR